MTRRLLSFMLLPLIVCPGCGSGNSVWVTGRLVKGGTKYVPPEGERINVTLIGIDNKDPTTKDGEPFMAEFDQNAGTFTVQGPERRGIPRGKYRVAITQKFTREAFDKAYPVPKKGVDRETDRLGNKFTLQNSPIVRVIKSSSDLLIDLDNPAKE